MEGYREEWKVKEINGRLEGRMEDCGREEWQGGRNGRLERGMWRL